MQKIKFFNKDGQPCALSNKFYKGYTISNIPNRFGFIYNEEKDQDYMEGLIDIYEGVNRVSS